MNNKIFDVLVVLFFLHDFDKSLFNQFVTRGLLLLRLYEPKKKRGRIEFTLEEFRLSARSGTS